MTPEQIKNAKTRAEEVVNGFKRVTEQNARDALHLAMELELSQRNIAAMKRRMLADELSRAASSRSSTVSKCAEFFKGLGL